MHNSWVRPGGGDFSPARKQYTNISLTMWDNPNSCMREDFIISNCTCYLYSWYISGMVRLAHLCVSHSCGHHRSVVKPMLAGSMWLRIACWNLVIKRGNSVTPRKYLLQRFQTKAYTLGQLLTTCNKHVRISRGATRAHLIIV